MTQEEELARLRAENQELRGVLQQTQEQLRLLQAQMGETQEQLRVAQARIQELEKIKTPPPSFVKARAKKPQEEEKKPRKKRDAKYNHARPRSLPTQIVEHRVVDCPDCHLRLGGISLARSREIIDIPVPVPVEVTEHRIYKGWCSRCQKWRIFQTFDELMMSLIFCFQRGIWGILSV